MVYHLGAVKVTLMGFLWESLMAEQKDSMMVHHWESLIVSLWGSQKAFGMVTQMDY